MQSCYVGFQSWGWAAPRWELRTTRLGNAIPSCPSLRRLPRSPAHPHPPWPLPSEPVLVTKGEAQPGYKRVKLNEVNFHTGHASLLVLLANLESLAGSVTSVTLDFITLDISMRVTHSLLKCIVCMSKDD